MGGRFEQSRGHRTKLPEQNRMGGIYLRNKQDGRLVLRWVVVNLQWNQSVLLCDVFFSNLQLHQCHDEESLVQIF